jgi:hypothetical protein
MSGTRRHAREASDATDAIARVPISARDLARDREIRFADGTQAGSGDRTFRGAQTVSIRVDASSMTTISRGTPRAAARVRVEGVDEAERTAANKKKRTRQLHFAAFRVERCRFTSIHVLAQVALL